MEAIGTAAAVIDLARFVGATYQRISDICQSKKYIAKATKGVRAQLEVLTGILDRLQQRCVTKQPSSQQSKDLAAVIKDSTDEIKQLTDLIDAAGMAGWPGFFKRAVFVAKGFDKKFKVRVEGLQRIILLLNLHLTEYGVQLFADEAASRLQEELRSQLTPCGSDHIAPKIPGTCDWIWDHSAFKAWLQPTTATASSRVLCVHGAKGSGKSVLASSIHNELKRRNLETVFFSFCASNERQRKFKQFLSTVLWQLFQASSREESLEIARELLQNLPLDVPRVLDAVNRILALTPSTVYLIVDGIDESSEDWNDLSNGCLKDVAGLVETHGHFRVLLIGREASLVAAMRTYTPRIELTEPLVGSDVVKLIDKELEDSPNIQPQELRDRVRDSLCEQSSTMFLWVSLVFKDMRHLSTAAQITEALQSPPGELYEAYCNLFRRLTERLAGKPGRPSVSMSTARDLLAIIINAAEPLTNEQLRYAYASLAGSGSDLDSHLISEDTIADMCGDFVRRDPEGYIHLAHATVEEFLTRPPDQWLRSEEAVKFYHVDLEKGPEIMTRLCLSYLSTIDYGYPLVEETVAPLHARHPFLRYASIQVAHHAMRVTSELEGIKERIREYLATAAFCGWIEYIMVGSSSDSNVVDSLPLFPLFSTWYDDVPKPKAPLRSAILEGAQRELTRRHEEMGEDDPRTQAWHSICLALHILDASVSEELPADGGSDSKTSFAGPSLKVPITTGDSQDARILESSSALAQVENREPVNKPPNPNLHRSVHDGLGTLALHMPQPRIPRPMGALVQLPVALRNMPLLPFPSTEALFAQALLSIARRLHPGVALLIGWFEIDVRRRKEEALDFFEIALSKTRNHGTWYEGAALTGIGSCLEHGEDSARVEVAARRAIDIFKGLPRRPQTEFLLRQDMLMLGRSLHRQGKDLEAIEWMERLAKDLNNDTAVRRRPRSLVDLIYASSYWKQDNAVVANNLGYDFNEQCRYTEAIQQFELSIAFDNAAWKVNEYSVLVSRNNLARTFVKMGRFKDAEEQCRIIIQATVNSSNLRDLKKHLDARNLLVNTMVKTGRFEEAEDQYRLAIRAAEDREDLSRPFEQGLCIARDLWAKSLFEAGRLEKAEEQCRLAIRGMEDYGGDYFKNDLPITRDCLAKILFEADRLEEAEEQCRLAIRGMEDHDGDYFEDDLPITRDGLAKILFEAHRLEEAEEQCRLAIRGMEDYDEDYFKEELLAAKVFLAKVLVEVDKLDEAEDQCRLVIRGTEESGDYLKELSLVARVSLARVLCRVDKLDEAEEQCRIVIQGTENRTGEESKWRHIALIWGLENHSDLDLEKCHEDALRILGDIRSRRPQQQVAQERVELV